MLWITKKEEGARTTYWVLNLHKMTLSEEENQPDTAQFNFEAGIEQKRANIFWMKFFFIYTNNSNRIIARHKRVKWMRQNSKEWQQQQQTVER